MLSTFSRSELCDWAKNSIAFYGLPLERISTSLLAQARKSELEFIFDVSDITAPIKALENLPNNNKTARENQFKHPPLIGLYKIHFTSPRFLQKNISNFINSTEGKRVFKTRLAEASALSGEDTVNDFFVNHLTYHSISDAFSIKNRTNTMTGEWIVFNKHKGENYYLTLASHAEEDSVIYERVCRACEFDGFPFFIDKNL